MEQIEKDMRKVKCNSYCDSKCQNHFKAASIYKYRMEYHTAKQGKKQMLLDKIHDHKFDLNGNRYYFLGGFRVCPTFFVEGVMCVSMRTYWRALCHLRGEQFILEPPRYNKIGDQSRIAVAFCMEYIKLQADVNPVTGKLIMPSGMTTAFIYEEYVAKLFAEDGTSNTVGTKLTRRGFYDVFKKHIRDKVSFCKKGNVSRCNVCFLALTYLATCIDPIERKIVEDQLREHYIIQSEQRQTYDKDRVEACTRKDITMVLACDGMDQQKTNLPHYRQGRVPKVRIFY
jgi:hypothetical protein